VRTDVKGTVLAILLLLAAVVVGGGFWLWAPDKPRALLESRYATAPSTFLDVAGLRLHVRDTGPKDAPAILLLHGFGSSLHTWEPWAQALSGTHRVVRIDLPGFGLTGPDPTGEYTDARSVLVLAALLDKLGIARASLIGNSMGGRIAWKFAAEFPQRVTKLVLISPDGFASPGIEYGRKAEVPRLAKAMQYVLPRPLLRMNLAPAYADPSLLTDEIVSRYYDLMLAPGVRAAIIARMEQSVLLDPEPLLRLIEAPTLLIWGEKDALIPVKNADDYIRLLPKSTLVTLPGLGHLPQEEAPARSLVPVQSFLAG
jgi:pimeloyl-ACP methyl ester carboxylesterase